MHTVNTRKQKYTQLVSAGCTLQDNKEITHNGFTSLRILHFHNCFHAV